MDKEAPLLKDATLFTGAKMPVIGYGTFLSENTGELVKTAILEGGYRHIDTASYYNNEEQIGKTLQEIFSGPSGLTRKDLFITTKAHQADKYDIKKALKTSLEKLKLEYVDLYLIHWPQTAVEMKDGKKTFARVPLHKIWKELEECVREGLTKHIGVSNFNVQIILDLLTYCEIPPAVNQVELHPFLTQWDLVEYMKKLGIVVTAYCPIGAPGRDPKYGKLQKPIIENEVILEIAKRINKTPAQVILNWGIQRGHVIIPKSSSLSRMKENLEAQNFTLSKEDVDKITALNVNDRIVDPLHWDFEMNAPIFA